jgi:type IX secretion system PorP/SprF family membrane protein
MNLTRIMITLIMILIISVNSNAQQEPRSAFFWNNYMHTNPAMTGAIYRHHANVQWRNQWTKVNGAPTTFWANYAVKLEKINSGIGGSYEYDVIGLNKSHTALLSYAYHLPIKNMFLSFGASAGIKTLKLDYSKFVFSQTPDPEFMNRKFDPVFQCDFGIALHSEKWNVGVSATQLNSATFRSGNSTIKQAPHIWLFAEYSIQLSEKWKLTPRLQGSSNLTKIATTLALEARFNENLWFGFTSSIPLESNGFTLGPMIGYDIVGKFRLGYTYEFGISTYLNTIKNNGTHEIILSYQLK